MIKMIEEKITAFLPEIQDVTLQYIQLHILSNYVGIVFSLIILVISIYLLKKGLKRVKSEDYEEQNIAYAFIWISSIVGFIFLVLLFCQIEDIIGWSFFPKGKLLHSLIKK